MPPRLAPLLLLTASVAVAQPTALEVVVSEEAHGAAVSARGLAEDAALLETALRAVHPGLALHRTPAEVDAVFARLGVHVDSLGRAHDGAVPVGAAYLAVAEALAGLRDGHTQLNPYNQEGDARVALFDRADRVPFAFRLIGGRMVVTGDATVDGVLPPRTEVLTLDGRPVGDVVAALLPYVHADGGNDAKRISRLQVGGTAPAEDFDILYSLVVRPEGPLALTVRDPDGTERALRVARTTRDERRDRLAARDPDLPLTDDDRLVARRLPDGTGYLRIGTFFTFNMETDYDAWLAGAFRDLADADRLVVDLRGNVGGMTDAAVLLLRHLLTEPAEATLWGATTAYDVFPEALRPHVFSWGDGYLVQSDVQPVGDGTFRLREAAAVPVPPAEAAFAGPAAVLVDAVGSSATFQLARAIQETGAARLVGQTTGGSLRGFNAGQTVFLRLPNTGLVVDVPLLGQRPAEPGPDRGVIPDVVVPLDADAVIAGRDPEMEAALSVLDR